MKPTNPAAFFGAVRAELFRGFMSQSQVDGTTALLDAWVDGTDPRWVAYALSTAHWETAQTMQPIAEYGRGRGRAYGVVVNGRVYYGRGYVQLTWLKNYEAMSKVTGVDLVRDPDRALEPIVAAKIMLHGMLEGTFTGKRLADYLNDKTTDFVNARRIINGVDHAAEIGANAVHFFQALSRVT